MVFIYMVDSWYVPIVPTVFYRLFKAVYFYARLVVLAQRYLST